MMTDIEGVSGVVSYPAHTSPDGRYYEYGKTLLTGEVNAAVAALAAAGATEVLVVDGHGPGAINFEDLRPPARLMHGRPIRLLTAMRIIEDYDLCLMIGQHAMAGTADGDLNHTQSLQVVSYELNGRPIGEIAQFALYAGAHEVPMIFLSGDEAACREAAELIPGIATAAVKQGIGRHAAICLPVEEAHRRIARGIAKAVETHRARPLPPLRWGGPFVLDKRYTGTEVADSAMGPGAERIDPYTVRLRSDNVLDIIYS